MNHSGLGLRIINHWFSVSPAKITDSYSIARSLTEAWSVDITSGIRGRYDSEAFF